MPVFYTQAALGIPQSVTKVAISQDYCDVYYSYGPTNLASVHVNNVPRDVVVCDLITFVQDDEEQVESRHNRSADVHVGLE